MINSPFLLSIIFVSALLRLFEKYGLQFTQKGFACLFGQYFLNIQISISYLI